MHALPSSHVAVLAKLTQPVALSQLSLVQTLSSLQPVTSPGKQAPAAHASPTVQASPSSHVAVVAVFRHTPFAPHESSVHGLPSLHASVDVQPAAMSAVSAVVASVPPTSVASGP